MDAPKDTPISMNDEQSEVLVPKVINSHDEGVELAGHGRYNYMVLVACCVISNAVALDMFGFGVVLAAASCDLQLGISQIGMLGSIPFGALLFAFPWGYYADTRGRRQALLLSCSVGFVMAALGSFSSSWQVLLVIKLVGCCFSIASYSLTMAYLGECTGSKHRSEYLFIMNSINLFSEAVTFILSLLILPLTFNIPIPWLSITYRPWRLLTLLMAIPLGVGAVMMFFLYESPKFLANSGQNDKALEVLRKTFEVNGGKKEDYEVKVIENNESESQSKHKFWESIRKQTVPIFKPPLLWRTLQLFYLLVIFCSTNNVFVMWYPTIVNSFFTSISKGVIEEQNFCERMVGNIAAVPGENGEFTCNDTISYNTIYSGIAKGFFFTIVNLFVAKLASWRRLVLLTILILSAVCSALINLISEPISSMILFTLIQGTSVGIGAVASYFLDLYPTSYRGLVTSLGMMVAKIGSFTGVNIVGFAITYNCSLTFYCWSVFVLRHGRYNYLVLVACCVISNAVALDMFGFGVVLAAASCDLQLGISQIGMLGSIPFGGLLFAFPWGYYADTRGRRRALLLSCSVGFVMAALGSFSSSWQVLLVIKLVGCCFSTAGYSLTMAYLGECTGSKHRSEYLFIMNSTNLLSEAVTFILALLILPLTFNIPIPWLSITYRPWRLLTLLMAIPLGVGAVMMFFLYESPKFLGNSGQNDKALEVLRKTFEVNGGKREDYEVKVLENNQSESQSKQKFWESIRKQTVPIFKPPLLWRTLQLSYLLVICCSTNNVFVMWYPTIVNSFFTSISKGAIEEQNFCERVVSNIAAVPGETGEFTCNDTISYNTIYSGIAYGFFFTIVNLFVAKLASWRRLVLLTILILSAVCSALINLISEPISSMILFTLIQGTSVGIGAVASYFLDLYPTSYRGLVTSLGMMVARFGSFIGVNIVGFAITNYCSLTFYCWSAFVFSGVAVVLLLPSDKKT